MSGPLELNFAGSRALIMHPATTVRDQLVSRLVALGLEAVGKWPPRPEEISAFDVLFVDVDTGHDELFPWKQAAAPIPVIGLIRSEAPGRLAWALKHDIDGYLSLAATGNVYSTLVIARARCTERLQRRARETELGRRNSLRHMLIRAVLHLMEQHGIDDVAALKDLRTRAMQDRETLEDAAVRLLSEVDGQLTRRRR